MPVTGLPLAAEMALNALIGQNMLSSWRISGGNKFATVTLRFHMDKGDNIDMVQSVQYRKKPPSQIARDRKRQSNPHNKMEGEKSNDNLDSENVDINYVNGTNEKLCEITSVEETGTPTGNAAEIDKSHVSQSNDLDVSAIQATIASSYSNLDQRCADIISHLDNLSMTIENQEIVQNECVCNKCGKKLEGSWKQCTQCIDFSLCHQCHSQGEHSIHSDQIHHFKAPKDMSSYCDSCGYEFRTRKAKYYLCPNLLCENYILCLKCKAEHMHRKHQ